MAIYIYIHKHDEYLSTGKCLQICVVTINHTCADNVLTLDPPAY